MSHQYPSFVLQLITSFTIVVSFFFLYFFFYRGFESQSAGVASQPVGFSSALQAARERIAVLTYGKYFYAQYVMSHQLILGIFIELAKRWSYSSSTDSSVG